MDKYFATLDGEKLSEELNARFDKWRTNLSGSGRESRLAKAYRYYYGQQTIGTYSFEESSINYAGDAGELAVYSTNHYRSILRGILALTTSQKPAFDTRAINTDLETIHRARIGSQIVEFYMNEKNVFQKLKKAAEISLVMAQGFAVYNWDPSIGKEVSTEPVINEETGEPLVDEDDKPVEKIIRAGDISVSVHSALDVMTDKGAEDWDDVDWADVRGFESKWGIAAKYPQHREDIISQNTEDGDSVKYLGIRNIDEGSDYIPIHTFYHRKTPALPNGRLHKRLANGTVLFDGPYPYEDKFNVKRIAAGEMFGSTEGYSDGFDLLPLQDVFNTIDSAIFTNQKSFGVQALGMVEGTNVTKDDVTNLAIFKVKDPSQYPRGIQLTSSPPEMFQMRNAKVADMEKLSGMNSAARGEPDSNLKSGVALGRMQAMAVQYSSNFQHSWARLLEDGGSFMIHLLKLFAKDKRLISIAGKRNRNAVKSFTAKDLEGIEGVAVDLGNPMSRTAAGKIELATLYLDKGIVKNSQEFITVAETGNLDPLTEGTNAENDLIRRENEMLMEGKGMDAMVGDKHILHMQEHRVLLADPYVRQNSEAFSVIVAHIQHHHELMMTEEPMWKMISGEPMPPPPMPPGPPPGPPVPPPQDPMIPVPPQPPMPEM